MTRYRIPEFLLGALSVLAAVSIILVISSRNNGATPSPDVPTRIESEDSKNHQSLASSGPASNEHPPVIVRIEKSEQEAFDEKQDREKKATTDWLLATYTGLLFFATLGLMVATIGLWYFALKQSRDMRESLAIASRPPMQRNRRPMSQGKPLPRSNVPTSLSPELASCSRRSTSAAD